MTSIDSLMGDQPRARKEYEAAFKKFSELPELHRVQWQTRAATTHARSNWDHRPIFTDQRRPRIED
jgi:hypothetical protein